MKKLIHISLGLALMLPLLMSCENNTVNPSQPAVATGYLYFHLHTYVDIDEVDGYNIVYTNSNNRKVSVSMAQLYLSNFKLVKSDGSIYSVPDTIILQDQGTETYVVAKVPAGNYKSIRFNVGLDTAQDRKLPTSNRLLNHSEMWLGSTPQTDGYVYVNFQGKIDTTTAADGTLGQMQPFSYKIATKVNFKQVSMPDKPFTILPDKVEYLHLLTDYNKLFNGVQLNNSSNLTINNASDNGSALANTIANNIPSMFDYEY